MAEKKEQTPKEEAKKDEPKAPPATPAKPKFRAVLAYPLRDPYQSVAFVQDEAREAELTVWVQSQIDAGLLVEEKE